jgi:hypothetical protein
VIFSRLKSSKTNRKSLRKRIGNIRNLKVSQFLTFNQSIMRKALRSFGFSVPFLLAATISVNAQNDRFAYAITDVSKDGAGWNALRKLDLRTGAYSDLLFNGTDQKTVAFDATTRKRLEFQPDAKYGNFMQSPFSTGVAAAAFDRKHNRLYFTPMFIDQLRYLDLSTMVMPLPTTAIRL